MTDCKVCSDLYSANIASKDPVLTLLIGCGGVSLKGGTEKS